MLHNFRLQTTRACGCKLFFDLFQKFLTNRGNETARQRHRSFFVCVCVFIKLHITTQSGPECVCVFSSHSFWTSSSLDVPAGVTQEEGHTGRRSHRIFHPPSFFCGACLDFSREHSFPSSTLKLNFVYSRFNRSPLVGHFYFLFFSEKNPVCRDRTHVPTCQKVTRLPLSYRGDTQ